MVEITKEMIMAKRIAELSDSFKKMSCNSGSCISCMLSTDGILIGGGVSENNFTDGEL